MAALKTTPEEKSQRDASEYRRIPLKLLDAILDQMDARVNGILEVNFAQGGVAKIFATVHTTYK